MMMNEIANLKKSLNDRPSGSGKLPSNTIANPKGDVKAISTRSGGNDGPSIPIPSPVKEMERETKVTKDPVLPPNNGSTHYVQTTVVPKSAPPVTPTSSRVDPTLARFTVKSLSSRLSDQMAAITYSHMLNSARRSVLDDSDDEEDSNVIKAITTRSGKAYDGPSTSMSPPLYDVEKETEDTTDKVQISSPRSTAQVPPPVLPKKKSKPGVVFESVETPEVTAPKSKPYLPYPSRMNEEKIREKNSQQIDKFFQIFKELHFDISFADALILMPKFAATIKQLLNNKEKLSEMAKTPVSENCSAVILKKLPEKLGDPGKFLLPCVFPGLVECYALADLGASINLMPYSVWKKLSLPELIPTCMTLELADRTISLPLGIAEDVFVKIGGSIFLLTLWSLTLMQIKRFL